MVQVTSHRMRASRVTSRPTSPTPMSAPPFGFLIPDHPLQTNFLPVDNTGLKFALKLTCPGDIHVPLASVTELVFFATNPLPIHQGVQCYWQIAAATSPDQATGFEMLGSITPQRPSAVFPTGWSEHEQLLEIAKHGTPVILTIGLAVECLDNIQNIQGDNKNDKRLFTAQKIALDLFRFMQSFDSGTGGSGQMVVPHNIFGTSIHGNRKDTPSWSLLTIPCPTHLPWYFPS